MFPTSKGMVYDNTKHLPRDVDGIIRMCTIAEAVTSMEMGDAAQVQINKEQKIAIDNLRAQNVHCHQNPFHYAAMGIDNNIFKANPPDLLHLFCAGLMKSLTQWVLTIILQVNCKCKILYFLAICVYFYLS